jgi:ankyrin repeat protein
LDIEHDYLNRPIDSNDNTALILATQHASPLTVRLLLEQGAQPDKLNGLTFHTPLGIIASTEYEDYYSHKAQQTLEMAKILLDYGAYVDKPSLRIYRDENNKDYYGKETPLMTAVRKQNLPLVTLLITRKANVNSIERRSKIRPYVSFLFSSIQSINFNFRIHFAITNGDEMMYDLLEKSGAVTPSIVTDDDNTLLHWFCYKKENDKNINLLNKLLAKGCDINAQNNEQLTPLMLAAKFNMIETCRVLLKNHADIDKHDFNGNQAIDLTIPGSECSKLLLQQKNIQISPTNEKVLWRKRIDSGGRMHSELNPTNQKFPSLTEEETNGHLRPSIYSPQKRNSEELDRKHEHLWDKFRHTSPKLKVFKTLHKKRALSAETRNQPS